MTTNPDSALAYLLRHGNAVHRPVQIIYTPSHLSAIRSRSNGETLWQRIRRALGRKNPAA